MNELKISNSTIPVTVSCHELNINSSNYLAFKVFPNPVQDILNVIIPPLNQPVTFRVFNISGVKIMEESVTLLKVDILESGVYFLEISSSRAAQVVKFIKS